MIFILILMATLLVFGFPVVFAKQNAIKIAIDWNHDTLKKEWHRTNVVLWLLCAFTFSVTFHDALGLWDKWWKLLLQIALFMVFARFVYWFLFDLSLNLFRSLPIWYDTPDKENSKSDNIANSFDKSEAVIKVGCIIGSALAYIISFII